MLPSQSTQQEERLHGGGRHGPEGGGQPRFRGQFSGPSVPVALGSYQHGATVTVDPDGGRLPASVRSPAGVRGRDFGQGVRHDRAGGLLGGLGHLPDQP